MTMLAGFLMALLVALGVQTWRVHSLEGDIAAAAAAAETQRADGEAAARTQEHVFATNARKAADVYSSNAARLRASASAASAADLSLGGLRDSLADQARTAAASAAPSGRADEAANARVVVGECAGALQKVAAAADDLEGRLTGLQDYVRAIGQAAPTGK